MIHPNIVKKAEEFATAHHAGQFLKNASASPFIDFHVRPIVELVKISIATDDEIAAAWLHDVVEDTPVTLEDIEREFGAEIWTVVDGLTDPPHFEGNPNKLRKKWQAERVKDKDARVKRVKIADQTINTKLMGFDPPIGWTPENRHEYVEGARWIVEACADTNEFLEKTFWDIYDATMREIKSAEAILIKGD